MDREMELESLIQELQQEMGKRAGYCLHVMKVSPLSDSKWYQLQARIHDLRDELRELQGE